VIDTAKQFAEEKACHDYLEAARWPKGIRCLRCDHDKVSKFTEKGKTRTNTKGITKTGPDRFMYQCLKCKYKFQTTTGTIFSDTHLPLSKWMVAVAIMCNAKKGVSAKQMERDMGVSYKTAWFLNHRIRKAMDEGFEGVLDGVKRRHREPWEKQPVFGVVKRATAAECSQVRAFPIPTNSEAILTGAVQGNVSIKAELLITDEWRGYQSVREEI
jgi:transposase-like protein